MQQAVNLVWFRRDLRLVDNHALYLAQQEAEPVLCIFIFDKVILDALEAKDDARLTFIHNEVSHIKSQLNNLGSDLLTYYGKPLDIWKKVLNEYRVKKVFINTDYEPYAKERDSKVKELLKKKDIELISVKDQVIFHNMEVQTNTGGVYKVYSQYKNKWLQQFKETNLTDYGLVDQQKLYKIKSPQPVISLQHMGFRKSNIEFPPREVKDSLIKNYDKRRDYPFEDATSRLGIHLRFGTISIRKLVLRAKKLNEIYLQELIWREFFMNILNHFPYVVNRAFKPKFDNINWLNNEDEFKKWCEGKTGVPIVDAGMRQLNITGFMHNRVRMICASFLTRNLLIDWRWGEAYFAQQLLDYELANNNGGWQWAAGTGVDAQPYFRIFNPESQANTWDREQKYIKKWVPEWGTSKYPKQPMVDLKATRQRALDVYKKAAQNS